MKCTIHGWYDPSDHMPLENVCVAGEDGHQFPFCEVT
jgi:hypothetical protein